MPRRTTCLASCSGRPATSPSALEHLERATALRPDSPDAHYNLGVAFWYSGAKATRSASCGQPAARSGAARLPRFSDRRCATGRPSGARRSLQRAIALLPPTPAIFVDLASCSCAALNLARGLGQLEAALNMPPPALPAPDWDGAIASLAGRWRRQPAAPRPQHARPPARPHGASAGRRGEFREAIRLRPDYAEAHNNLGLVLFQSGDDAAGSRRSRGRPHRARLCRRARQSRGGADADRRDEAIRELRAVLKLAPHSVKAQFNLAMAYGASPDRGRGERDRAAAEGHLARRRRSPARTSRSARHCCRTARSLRPSTSLRRPRGSIRRTAKLTTSLGSRWRAPGGRTTRQPSSRRAVSSWPPTTAARRRPSTSPTDAWRSTKAIGSRPLRSFATRSSSPPIPEARRYLEASKERLTKSRVLPRRSAVRGRPDCAWPNSSIYPSR